MSSSLSKVGVLVLLSAVSTATALSPAVCVRCSNTARHVAPLLSSADNRKTVAKARRAVISEGKGGMTSPRAKAKRSERKKPAAGKGFGKPDINLKFHRLPSDGAACACDKGRPYGECCKAAHGGAAAATPSDLVRARYTAFSYRLPDFLMETTDPEGSEYEPDLKMWKKSLLAFCVSTSTATKKRGTRARGALDPASA